MSFFRKVSKVSDIKSAIPFLEYTTNSRQLHELFNISQEGEHEYMVDEYGFSIRMSGYYDINEMRHVAEDQADANKVFAMYKELRNMIKDGELFEVIQEGFNHKAESVYFTDRDFADAHFAQNIINQIPSTMMNQGNTLYQYHPDAPQQFEFELRMFASKDDKIHGIPDFFYKLPSKSLALALAREYTGCYWIEIFQGVELVEEINCDWIPE